MNNVDIYEQFNSQFNVLGLQKDIEDASKPLEKVKVPYGDYEVSITKLTLGVNDFENSASYGCPQLTVWFKVIEGDYKGQLIFMNQNIFGQHAGFQLHNINTFLESLESGVSIQFQDFVQYAELINDVFTKIEEDEFQLSYQENSKGYKTYTIVKKFTK